MVILATVVTELSHIGPQPSIVECPSDTRAHVSQVRVAIPSIDSFARGLHFMCRRGIGGQIMARLSGKNIPRSVVGAIQLRSCQFIISSPTLSDLPVHIFVEQTTILHAQDRLATLQDALGTAAIRPSWLTKALPINSYDKAGI